MNSKEKLITSVVFVVVVLGSGLIGYNLNTVPTDNSPTYTTTFTDSRNRTVTIPFHPIRIVSMSPSITEILFAVGAQDRVVGVTDFCNYPAEATEKESIGGFSTPNLEKLSALNPDLIISATYDQDSIAKLEQAGYAVIIMEADTIVDILELIRTIGNIVDEELNTYLLLKSLYAEYYQVTNKTSTLNDNQIVDVCFEIWESPMVVGKESYLNDMIEKAGGKNIFENTTGTYPVVSNENIIDGNPDAYFITQHSAAWYSQTVCNRTGYSSINACVNNRIYSVDDDIYLRQGPRVIDALVNMTNYLHPGLL